MSFYVPKTLLCVQHLCRNAEVLRQDLSVSSSLGLGSPQMKQEAQTAAHNVVTAARKVAEVENVEPAEVATAAEDAASRQGDPGSSTRVAAEVVAGAARDAAEDEDAEPTDVFISANDAVYDAVARGAFLAEATAEDGDASKINVQQGSVSEENPTTHLSSPIGFAPAISEITEKASSCQNQQSSGEPCSESSPAADANTASYAGMSPSGSMECYTFNYDAQVELRYGDTSAVAEIGRYRRDANTGVITWDSGGSTYVTSESGNLSINGLQVTQIATCAP